MFFLKCFFYNLLSLQNERVTGTELRNTNEQNVMRYIQIKKIENISSKKIQAIAIYLFPTLYLRN